MTGVWRSALTFALSAPSLTTEASAGEGCDAPAAPNVVCADCDKTYTELSNARVAHARFENIDFTAARCAGADLTGALRVDGRSGVRRLARLITVMSVKRAAQLSGVG